MSEDKSLERLLDAFEQAVLAAHDGEMDVETDSAAVAATVAGVLKAYGYRPDGSRLTATRQRRRLLGRGPTGRGGLRARVAQEPLRASFSPASEPDDDDEGGRR